MKNRRPIALVHEALFRIVAMRSELHELVGSATEKDSVRLASRLDTAEALAARLLDHYEAGRAHCH